MKNPALYLALTIAAVLAVNAGGVVRDTDGHFLRPSVGYYVLPVLRGRGGGLTLTGRGNKTCPLDVVQETSEVDEGFPVKFSNWRPKVPFVPESQDLNIKTDVAATICVQSTFWWIDELDKEREQWFVTTGAEPSGHGPKSLKSFFKIKRSGDDYKFVFCPQFCDFCRPLCSDVGIFVDENGVRRLALSNVPFEVKFKKANGTQSSIETM